MLIVTLITALDPVLRMIGALLRRLPSARRNLVRGDDRASPRDPDSNAMRRGRS
jgi:hypothetical protein